MPGYSLRYRFVLDDCETNVYTESNFPALYAKNITITKSDVYVQSKGDAGIWSNGVGLSVSGSPAMPFFDVFLFVHTKKVSFTPNGRNCLDNPV